MYGEHVAGGDIHFFNMAQATLEEGYPLHFFGGHALKKHLEGKFNVAVTLTDKGQIGRIGPSLTDQFRLLRDYLGRFAQTLSGLREIQRHDIVYAVTDYWFDAWPVIFSRARRKLMILGMDAPSLGDIVFRRRPDVTATRLNSIYYWLSQNLSLRLFKNCEHKRLFYVHPSMKPRLLRLGYHEHELAFISNGFNLETAERVPQQPKAYDVVWIGRVHRQKGIDDLLETLEFLRDSIPGFRAVLVGRLEDELRSRVQVSGLDHCVHFAGLVSEEEKFRLFKSSRLFLMPSQYESWGIVIGEALACGLPVVAYDLDAYRPIFGDLVRYVPRFDSQQFKATSLRTLQEARAGLFALPKTELERLKAEHSWQAARDRFKRTLEELTRE